MTSPSHKRPRGSPSRRYVSPDRSCAHPSHLLHAVVVVVPSGVSFLLWLYFRCSVRRRVRGRCSRAPFGVWSETFCREETVWFSRTESPTLGRPSPSSVRAPPPPVCHHPPLCPTLTNCPSVAQVRTTTRVCCPGPCRSSSTASKAACTAAAT